MCEVADWRSWGFVTERSWDWQRPMIMESSKDLFRPPRPDIVGRLVVVLGRRF
jgi:hypothetical protein